MAKKKRLGHGVRAKIGSAYVGFVKGIKQPGISREAVNVTTTESVVEEFLDADPPTITQMTINGFYDPESSEDIAIETLMLNDAIDEREVTIDFEWRSSSSGTAPTASTWTYKYRRYVGRIMSLEPGEVTSKGEHLWTITFQPTAMPTTGTVGA